MENNKNELPIKTSKIASVNASANNVIKLNDIKFYDLTDTINPSRLFTYLFGGFPNIIGLNPSSKYRDERDKRTFLFDVEETIKALEEIYAIQINRVEDIDEEGNIKNKRITVVINECHCILSSREESVYHLDTSHISDFHELFYEDYNLILPILEIIWQHAFKTIEFDDERSNLQMIIRTSSGFDLLPQEIKSVEVDIDKNYNDDFVKADQTISSFIEDDEKSGLIILNGTMGTGKTTYIRHLITKYKYKKFIFGTRDIAEELSSPSFITFLTSIRGSILILEDCENIVQSRENTNHTSAITNILNMCDGMLSDAFNIKLIVTFNTDLKNIDKALKRKGRLRYQYTFKELDVAKSNVLLQTLGISVATDTPMTLADIYNYDEDNNANEKQFKTIGFGN